jgi:hypothetical protein
MQHDARGLRDRDRGEGRRPRPETGRANLARQALDRDTTALLRLGARHADRVDAKTLLENRKHRGRDASEHGEGNEQISEVHDASVREETSAVNAQKNRQLQSSPLGCLIVIHPLQFLSRNPLNYKGRFAGIRLAR